MTKEDWDKVKYTITRDIWPSLDLGIYAPANINPSEIYDLLVEGLRFKTNIVELDGRYERFEENFKEFFIRGEETGISRGQQLTCLNVLATNAEAFLKAIIYFFDTAKD